MSLVPYYEHAGITIYHGDARFYLDELPNVFVTDPPYGLPSWSGGRNHGWSRIQADRPKWDVLQTDIVTQIASSGKPTIIWGGNNYPLPTTRCWLAWVKNNAPP